jgi:hypothetical protein
MPLWEAGTTFLDFHATNIHGQKPKYYISLNNADDEDDVLVSFVFNTERRMDLYHTGCNKGKGKFVVVPGSISFISEHSSIMLALPAYYLLKEIIDNSSVKILEKVGEKLLREIKNCLDLKHVIQKYHSRIKDSFK